MRLPMVTPAEASSEMEEGRNAWRHMMRRSERPLDRAMVMKSSCRVEMRSFRKRRKYRTIDPRASTIEGRIIVWMFDQKFWVNGTYDAGPGKMCQCTAKSRTRTGPMTNGGRARKPKAVLFEA